MRFLEGKISERIQLRPPGLTGKGTEYILTRHKDAIKTPSGQSTRLPWRESLPAGRQGRVGVGVKKVLSPTLGKGGEGGFEKIFDFKPVAPSFIEGGCRKGAWYELRS